MKRLLLVILFIQLVVMTNAQTIHRLNNTTIDGAALSRRIEKLMDTTHVTGMVVSVFNYNRPVYMKAFGYANMATQQHMDTSTIFWSCSLSKAVFGYCVMRLVEKNIIQLDTPLVNYLPKPLPDYVFTKKTRGYQDIRNDLRYQRITARMCLNHTTGFPNYRGFEPDGKLVIKYDPGTKFSYSGEGMYLLQFVLEQITGKSYETLAQEEVFKPLNMQHTSYVWQEQFNANHAVGHDTAQHPYEFDERTSPHAAGSMYTNISDYNKFFAALLQHKGLSVKSFNSLFHSDIAILSKQQFGPNSLVDDKTPANTPLSYGLGFGLLKTPVGTAFFKEGHSEGWDHYAIGFPAAGSAIIIMTNSDNTSGIFKELLENAIGDVYTQWFWENYLPYNYVSQQ
ncbi:CubicO group peptidase (beta-lactamase class C family) [Chitinophaga dinghuensis]|uniref:CubicO group peptidase (Beta-lactamase class C family) n=1 Tax=Chitinophaga dinghuensis TaxID=1539050 RepID=A0A327WJT0_9BACT|nr:serine hydrolase domain-containing protein [Chitinophaga dinghuensis]RAJ88044.1 CubicO group peptidase (beta-lactamase class C family) [Chitinophaga dinghuensis]